MAASCENCKKGYIIPGEPTGTMVGGAYFRTAPSGTESKSAIVLLTDIFGLPLINSKIIADLLAEKTGFDVWVPDLFDGRPAFEVDDLEPLVPQRPGEKMTLWSKLRLVVVALTRLLRIFAVRQSVVDPRATSFIEKIKAEKKYEKIGCVGYCFGAGVAVRIAPGNPNVNSLVLCHPSALKEEQIEAIKVPSAWACAEDDMAFTPDIRSEAEAVFAARKDKPEYVDYEFVDYKGTVHGFAARPNLSMPDVKEAYEGALEQTAAWFKKTL
ncbi:dienelactone hydrolase endo-1-3,1,4-beta-D-glucanase [Stereum hirsutum FP-91666 SS1]|uniref:dienelactone hydrolase endo-1-3,1,4-beta-D-glucanase n=1 Tax=Stereum hirsutum (strain FP-91666) TaxID=721885 RepID=UPI000440D91A|nr:dienelactone hydrolase endo-1-3,1,4-beta-D-glucanase [Stereum hirsutum FP-91666 SS1]EIM87387.1 dienelactone hydrolase endo-1-3,1,4-beta-D-glucanase [Stereum hirsutum FP-91666 SS1]